MKTITSPSTVQSTAYIPLYDHQSKPKTQLAAHWLKDKDNRLYCCWVEEAIKPESGQV